MSIIRSKYTMTQIKSSDCDAQSAHNNIPIISDNCRITDTRLLKDFKLQTFGGYNIAQASLALDKAILEDKLEPSLHWCLQLFLSGILSSLWSKLLCFASKQINIYNPKLPEFIYNKNQQWQIIVDNPKYSKDNILLLRNHPTIRLLLAEMIAVLVLSKKRKIIQPPKIKKEEFIIDNFKSKLEAKDNNLVDNIIADGDPREIRIAVNEMAHHIYNKHITKALYWLNWIIEWEKINSKKYGKYECSPRTITGIDSKYCKDVVWLIWNVIHKIKQLNMNNMRASINICDNQIQCLWKLYINKFTPATRCKRQSYIIWSILYLIEPIDYTIPLIDRPTILYQSILGFDKIVSTLKSQQITSNTNNADVLNVIVEDNYMIPEKHQQMQEHLRKQEVEKLAKKKKINVNSLTKLEQMNQIDKFLY